MTAPVFVVPEADLATATVGSIVRVGGPEGRHAITVRRLTAGESVALVDGTGRRASGVVSHVVDRQAFDVDVTAFETETAPQPRLVVVQALPKGERGELAVELLTEVGVDVIVPWAAANCVTQWRPDRSERAHRRWADAALAAAKQSRRARFPAVEPLASTADVVARISSASQALVLHESATAPIGAVRVVPAGDLVLVIGPEGGLTPVEIAAFADAGATTVRLGPSVLRTSSAGMAAASVVLASSGRWSVEG
ncbi:MAG: 16S rRNA (uracil(1498)-N(3))-methyltransferase [Actinobacteria bacterium]|nr:16S rRNA (uracil(1498)-N(3))-methyltransferase [Actinomycetota bacterium]